MGGLCTVSIFGQRGVVGGKCGCLERGGFLSCHLPCDRHVCGCLLGFLSRYNEPRFFPLYSFDLILLGLWLGY